MIRPLIAGNWKMHKSAAEAASFVGALAERLPTDRNQGAEVGLYVPFTALWAAVEAVADSQVVIGAQNVYCEDQGAFTGEVSPPMLRETGATSVLVGHSERRHLLGEDDDLIARKVSKALEHGLNVILCVGETIDERDAGAAHDVVGRQLERALDGLSPRPGSLDVAYEPVWAIGTGRTATAEQAQEMHAFIRQRVGDRAGRILYGGSVKPDNAATLLSQADVGGLLVGGASLDIDSFSAIVASA